MVRARRGLAAVTVGGAALLSSACASPVRDGNTETTTDFADLVSCMVGSFASTDQAKADDRYYDVRVHMVRIWPHRHNGTWIYAEQAMGDEPERPYRQRVYRITEPNPGEFLAQIYTIPDPDRWIGEWENPGRFNDIKPKSLDERDGCAITMHRDPSTGEFAGSTSGHGCGSELRGAAYSTSEARFSPTDFTSWDRGYDASGSQVWGAVAGPYRFVRATETK